MLNSSNNTFQFNFTHIPQIEYVPTLDNTTEVIHLYRPEDIEFYGLLKYNSSAVIYCLFFLGFFQNRFISQKFHYDFNIGVTTYIIYSGYINIKMFFECPELHKLLIFIHIIYFIPYRLGLCLSKCLNKD
jgi:hypothetical protein